MRYPIWWLAALTLVCVAALPAMQIQELELVSPVNGKPFTAQATGVDRTPVADPANMGTDVDGCRHGSGPSEYDYFIIVDPYSYFASLAHEWDPKTQKLRGGLSPTMVDWVRKAWSSEREIDFNRAYQYAQSLARSMGRQAPDRASFVIPQDSISIEKRYNLALACYEYRVARNIELAKIALSGAWAVRCHAQIPMGGSMMDGGVEEVNKLVSDHIKDGEAFDLDKWIKIFRSMVERDGLSREGYVTAVLTLHGYEMRGGNQMACKELMARALKRLGEEDKQDQLRGMIRERKRLRDEHDKLLKIAAERFTLALQNEEVIRLRIPEIVLAVAECHRRTGDLSRAADWFFALGQMPETQPSARHDLRELGRAKALPPDKPLHMQLGWIADEQMERLRKDGLNYPGELSGPDRGVLIAVVKEGLGTANYNVPGWKPAKHGTKEDSERVMKLIGTALLKYSFDNSGKWPKSLGELWECEILRDRNQVNRFHCPASGGSFIYTEPTGDITRIAQQTVLLTTELPVESKEGPRFGAFIANCSVVWTEQPLSPGQVLSRP